MTSHSGGEYDAEGHRRPDDGYERAREEDAVCGQRADRAQPQPGGDRRAELQRQPVPPVHGHRAGAASEGGVAIFVGIDPLGLLGCFCLVGLGELGFPCGRGDLVRR